METWEKESTFSESIESRREKNSPFTFLEGPPTANGRPGIHTSYPGYSRTWYVDGNPWRDTWWRERADGIRTGSQ